MDKTPSDSDANLSEKEGEQKALTYKTHHSIDVGSRVIVDCHVTIGSVSDVIVFIY